jgi:hypothetical protein
LGTQSDGSTSNHEHSKNEICFYSKAQFDYFDISPGLQIAAKLNPETKGYFIHNEKYFQLTLSLHTTLRGPPVFQIA